MSAGKNDHYTMPRPLLGETVLWYQGGDRYAQPTPAIVTDVGLESLCVNIVSPTCHNFIIRDGCRHINDPKVTRPEAQDSGGWDFTEHGKILRELQPLTGQAAVPKK